VKKEEERTSKKHMPPPNTRGYIMYPPVSKRHLGFQLSPKSHAIKAAELEYQRKKRSDEDHQKTESYKPDSSKLQYLPRQTLEDKRREQEEKERRV